MNQVILNACYRSHTDFINGSLWTSVRRYNAVNTHRATYLGPVEDVLNRQHGHDGEHLFTAAQMDGHDQHLTQHGLQRELSHLNNKRPMLIKHRH